MKEAAQYVHPKLSAIAMLGDQGLGARLDRAIARSGVTINGHPNVIEAQAQPGPFKRRF